MRKEVLPEMTTSDHPLVVKVHRRNGGYILEASCDSASEPWRGASGVSGTDPTMDEIGSLFADLIEMHESPTMGHKA